MMEQVYGTTEDQILRGEKHRQTIFGKNPELSGLFQEF